MTFRELGLRPTDGSSTFLETLLLGAEDGGTTFLWNPPSGSWRWGQYIPLKPTVRELKMGAVHSFETHRQEAEVGDSTLPWNLPSGSWRWGQYIPLKPTVRELKLGAAHSSETHHQGAEVGGSTFLWNLPSGSWRWGQYIPLKPTVRELKLGAVHSFETHHQGAEDGAAQSSESLITKFSERKMEAAGFSEPLIHTRLYGVIPEDYSSYLRRSESLSSHNRV